MDELSLARAAADPEVAGRPALIVGGATFSFAALAERASVMGAALREAGVSLGSRVALLAPNGVDTVVAIHALLDLGATIVPIHPRLTAAEAAVILADAKPLLVLCEADLGRLAATRSPSASPTTEAPRADAPLAIVYTSGTTGRPKGAVLSRRAFLASAAGSTVNLGWIDADRWLCCMPLCHVGGLSILTRCLIARRAVILVPRFDPEAILAAIDRERATLLSVVPTMLQALLERDDGNVLARLRAVLVGGAAAPASLLEACARRGVPALTTYGLTEACSQVTVQRPAVPHRAAPGSGVPLAGVEIRIARADGSEAPRGEVGRIQVRGPTLMDGYFRGPDCAPEARVDAEGFFDTGDLGERDDDGALHVHARRNDLIVTGGENVYPVEVEQRLEAIAGVRRALVFGVPDERWGQIVAAALETEPSVDLDDIAEAAAQSLAPHKRPRLACVVAALPLTGSGKLDRTRVVDRYAALLRPFNPARRP
ncbi:O-succinylbenzoic acid--CoA ligase [Minicystis rosea]|nr:O-succinylbenzoic acid--CoA ligase [Minicystis rosea]